MSLPGIVVLTGAGISRESGLATFRDPDGLWAKVRVEDVATPEAFARDPDRVLAFYDARRAQLSDPKIQPNAAHFALAAFDHLWTGEFLLVTQNVDDLHDRAGSRRLLHMHGELAKARCLDCGVVQESPTNLSARPACRTCRAARLRPHVVWFGEMSLELELISEHFSRCGLFVSIGTSGNVYPAAGFVRDAGRHARTVELNLEPSAGASLFAEAHQGPATTLVPRFFSELLATHGLSASS